MESDNKENKENKSGIHKFFEEWWIPILLVIVFILIASWNRKKATWDAWAKYAHGRAWLEGEDDEVLDGAGEYYDPMNESSGTSRGERVQWR